GAHARSDSARTLRNRRRGSRDRGLPSLRQRALHHRAGHSGRRRPRDLAWITHEASTARADKADLTGVLGPRALRRSARTTSRALGPAGARDLGLLRALATNPQE